MENIKFEYKGLAFQIENLELLTCEGVTVANIQPEMTLEAIKNTCELYVLHLDNIGV